METGSIVSWEKQEGDEIAEGDLLAEIETDKATVGFESSENGYLAKIILPAGSKDIPLGTLVCIIVEDKADIAAFESFTAADAGTPAAAPAAPEPAVPVSTAVATDAPVAPKAGPPAQPEKARISFGRDKFASPLAKLLAREKGVDVKQVQGSGPGGRVIGGDVAAAPVSAPQPVASAPSISAAPFEDIPLTSMRKVIANRLTQSKQTIPHYYLTVDVPMDKIMSVRKKLNAKLTDHKISVNDFVIKVRSVINCHHPRFFQIQDSSSVKKTF